jgi:hypothetical protein
MSKVTYRGVPYDTEDTKELRTVDTVLTYRGVSHRRVILPPMERIRQAELKKSRLHDAQMAHLISNSSHMVVE